MRKRVFLIFAAMIALPIASLLWFIQTPYFAKITKQAAARYLPSDLGLDGDFSGFAIQLFPPGVSLKDPRLSLREKNALDLPAGSSVRAERMDLNFRLFQMFSGTIRIHEVVIVNGDARLVVDAAAPARKSKASGFSWDQLVNVRADGVALENTHLAVELKKQAAEFQVLARTLRLSQSDAGNSDELQYELSVDLTQINGRFPREWAIPKEIPDIAAFAKINAKGIRIEKLQALFASGMSLESTGNITGDLLNPSSLDLSAELRGKGELADALTYLSAKPQDVGGRFQINAKVGGNLLAGAQKLRIEGALDAENGHFREWQFDQCKIEGAWTSARDGGTISVSQGIVSAVEIEREGAHTPGQGGKIEIGAFHFKPDQKEPVTIPLNLRQAHIHWLAAPAIKDIFPLQFRGSGPVKLTISPEPRAWSVRADADLTIENFQLDNQRLGENRPLNKVLQLPKLRLAGDVTINGRGIQPGALALSLPQTNLALSGRIDFKNGFELLAKGPVSLQDIGHIAEVPISGTGELSVRVHGPSSAIVLDFDTDLRDAKYLGLNLGSLKGRISWDDDPENLLFSAIQLKRGETPYLGNGVIHLGKNDSINLDFRFANGTIQDLSSVFDGLTADLGWYPRALRGGVTGSVKITGGLSMNELVVDAQVDGYDWDFYGETLRKVRAAAGYDRGKYQITRFEGLKKSGKVSGTVSFDRDRRIEWNLSTENLKTLDLDHLARMDVPIRGQISIASKGQGIPGAIRSETQATLTELSVRGVNMGPSELRMKSESDSLHVTGTALGGQGALELLYDFQPGSQSFLRAELQHLDFSPLLLLINPTLANDRSLTGFVSGGLNVSFRSGEAERGSGRVELTELVLAKSNSTFRLLRPASTKVSDGSFDLSGIVFRGPEGEATAQLRSGGIRLEGLVSGEIDMSILEFLVSPVTKATGSAQLNFGIAGTLKEPSVIGRLNLLDGVSLRIAALDTPIENIAGSLQLKQNVISAHNLEADLAGGRLSAEGTVQLFPDRFPSLALRGNLSGNKLRFFPFQFAKVQGGLRVTGDTIPYQVDGDLFIESALSTEKVFNQKPAEGLKAARYMPPPGSRIESSYPKFLLNIKARADRGVLIQNELFDVEMKGNFTVVNTIETPRILGTAELVQGKIIFKNRAFQIQSASAQFDNPTVINPLFDLIATTDVDNTKIQLYASGRMDKWKLDLSSNPVMPESEILSLLALGLSSSDVKRLGAADRSVFEQGEGLSLLLHSLDFNREVQNRTGFQIQLGDAVDSQIGSSIARPQVQTDSVAAPKITIKRQDFLIKNLDLSAGSTLGIGENSRKEVNAELRLSPGLSVLGVWDYRESGDAKEKTSYGADLKLQRRFK